MHRIIEITAFTHQGKVRENNQDTIVVNEWVRNAPMSTPRQWRFSLEDPVLCAVADGIGGQAAGEIASQYVAEKISKSMRQIIDAEALRELLGNINVELYGLMAANYSRIGMGTTLAGLLLNRERLFWFNVGDSRLYRLHDGFLRQISVDDVPASSSPAANHRRQSHAITQSLGGAKTIQTLEPHTGSDEFIFPSRWLVCSDGLTDMVGIDDMIKCLNAPDLDAISKLVQTAMNAGGADNISIIIVSVF